MSLCRVLVIFLANSLLYQNHRRQRCVKGARKGLKREKSLSGQDVIFVGDGGTGSVLGSSVCPVHPPSGHAQSTNKCQFLLETLNLIAVWLQCSFFITRCIVLLAEQAGRCVRFLEITIVFSTSAMQVIMGRA